jgi:hypothetical protein
MGLQRNCDVGSTLNPQMIPVRGLPHQRENPTGGCREDDEYDER